MWAVWLIACIIFSLAEFYYKGFILIWFGASAFITFIFSFFIPSGAIQLGIFLILSVLLTLLLSKRFTLKFPHSYEVPQNLGDLVGKKGIVIKSIGPSPLETGLIKLDGEKWPAYSSTNEPIPKGTVVKIETIQGVRAKVIKS